MSEPKPTSKFLLVMLLEQLPAETIREIVGGIAEHARTSLPTGAPTLAALAAEAAGIVVRHGALDVVLPALDRRCLRRRECLAALAREAGIVLPLPRVLLLHARGAPGAADAVSLAVRLRRDGFDVRLEQPGAGPRDDDQGWLAQEIELADAVVVLCTAALRHAVEGDEDDQVEPVVALLREREGAELVRWVPVVIEANETAAAIPGMLAGRDAYLLPSRYEAMLGELMAIRARSPATTLDARPPLRRRERPFAVVGDPADSRAVALGRRLGVAVDAGDRVTRALNATVVILASSQLPLALERLTTATDRDLLRVDAAAVETIVERAVRLHRARMRAWWRRAGSELMCGVLAAGSAPALAACAWRSAEQRPLIWTAVWLLGAGFILRSGLLADAAATAGRAPADPGEARRWFLVVVEYAMFGADVRSRIRRLGALVFAFMLLWATFFGVMHRLTPGQRAPLLVIGAGALAIGGLALVLVGRSRRRWHVALAAATLITLVGANVLTNLGLRWAERDEPWSELLPVLLALPPGYVPATWLLAAPGLAPLCVVAAVVAASACAQPVPRLRGHRAGLRAAGASLLALALAWWFTAG